MLRGRVVFALEWLETQEKSLSPRLLAGLARAICRFNAVRLVPFVWYIELLPIRLAERALKNLRGDRYDGYGSRIRRWLLNLITHCRPAIP